MSEKSNFNLRGTKLQRDLETNFYSECLSIRLCTYMVNNRRRQSYEIRNSWLLPLEDIMHEPEGNK